MTCDYIAFDPATAEPQPCAIPGEHTLITPHGPTTRCPQHATDLTQYYQALGCAIRCDPELSTTVAPSSLPPNQTA